MPRRGAPLPGIPGCSRTSRGRSAACPDDDRAAEWWTSRHRLWGSGPACRVGIRRRAVPAKAFSVRVLRRLCWWPGGTLIFLNSIPALLSVFDFRTGPAIPGGRAVEAKKAAKPFSGFAALTPLCGGAHARNPIFSLQIGDLCVGVGFGKLSLLSVLSSRTEQKRPDFPLLKENPTF